jgi:hypothetical protein
MTTPTIVIDPLLVQLRRVAEARAGAVLLADALKVKQAEFYAANTQLSDLVAASRATVLAEEAVLRELTVRRYEETGEKHPAPGLGIRLVKVIDYEAGAAFAWAKETGMALALDRKAFEKIATVTSVPCATVREEPQATIAERLEIP